MNYDGLVCNDFLKGRIQSHYQDPSKRSVYGQRRLVHIRTQLEKKDRESCSNVLHVG